MKRMNGEGSIYYDKQRGRYIVSVSAGKDPQTHKPIRVQKTARSPMDAISLLTELRKKYLRQTSCCLGMNFASYLKLYAEAFKKPNIRENTWQNYETMLKHAEEIFSGLTFGDLTPTLLQKKLSEMPSQNTAHRLAILAKSACGQALREGLTDKNPMEGVCLPAPKRKKEICVSEEEITRLLKAAEQKPPLRMAILLQYMTGLRAEEVLGLTWEKIDLDSCTLKVEQVTNQVHDQVSIAPPKTKASRRQLPFPDKLRQSLLDYRQWQEAEKNQKAHLWQGEDPGFLYTYDGSPLGIHQYASAFRNAARKAAVKASPHALRHTHATRLFMLGWQPKDVQARLGHSSIAITMDTYTHYTMERSRQLADSLEELYPEG